MHPSGQWMIKIELGFVSDIAAYIRFTWYCLNYQNLPSDSSDITTQHQVHLIKAAISDTHLVLSIYHALHAKPSVRAAGWLGVYWREAADFDIQNIVISINQANIPIIWAISFFKGIMTPSFSTNISLASVLFWKCA